MATYIVFIRDRTRNQSEMDAYTPKAGASLAGHPIKILAAYGHHRIKILRDRGVDVDSLPREIVPKDQIPDAPSDSI